MLTQVAPSMTLRSKLVHLRLLERADLPLTMTWRNNIDIGRWFFDSKPITWEQHCQWFERYERKTDDHTFIIVENKSGKPVGQIALYDITERSAQLGRVMIGEAEAQGQGYAHHAVRTLLKFAFEKLNLTKVYLRLKPENMRAFNLYHDCGFIVDHWGQYEIQMVTVNVG